MTVVRVRKMRMTVPDRLVLMLVRVWLRPIPREGMIVLMMGVMAVNVSVTH